MDQKNGDSKEKPTTSEVKSQGDKVAETSSISPDGIGKQPDAEQTLHELRARLAPPEAVAVREKLQQRSDEAFERGDFKTAKALRDEAQAIGQEASEEVGPGTVLLLLGAAALGLYVVSERQRQAQQAAAAGAAAAAIAAARQQQGNQSA